jgi:hypothetical protein
MKLMKYIKELLRGKSLQGDNILDIEPKFKTVYPDTQLSFNDWSLLNNVSSRVPKYIV